MSILGTNSKSTPFRKEGWKKGRAVSGDGVLNIQLRNAQPIPKARQAKLDGI
jgi:hypothetical protein